MVAFVGVGLFGMSIEVSYCLGYALAAVATAIVVPQLMRLNN